jgi:hypothetical protein
MLRKLRGWGLRSATSSGHDAWLYFDSHIGRDDCYCAGAPRYSVPHTLHKLSGCGPRGATLLGADDA